MSELTIAVVIGSLRRDSLNRKLADAIRGLGPDDVRFETVRIDDLPLYNQDDDANPGNVVKRLKAQIAAAYGAWAAEHASVVAAARREYTPYDRINMNKHNQFITSNTIRKYCAGLGFTALTLLAAACASVPVPTDQMAVANAALANAVSAGGTELAPAQMRLSRDKLERANQAMAAKDYDQARTLAEQAEVDAQLAATNARYAKARQAASVLQEDSRVLREEINRTTQQTSPTRN
jgi:Domain of unknown function (DUF4398)/NADPH-dependent FMN reductase